jgi:phage terminase large subunit
VETNNVPVTWLPVYNILFEFNKYRIKVFYGGRGGAKTIHFGLALLGLAQQYKMRILCAREIQNSIADSVHQTLEEIINKYELTEYDVTEKKIYNKITHSEFIFKGLRKETVSSLKSIASIDLCWVEEANSVSENSWDILIPTIRNDGSEIWVSFNPEWDDDPAYEMFVTNKYEDTYVKKIGWQDNKFLPEVLKKEKDKLYKLDPIKARWIWGGETKSNYEANIYHWDESVNCVENELINLDNVPIWTGWDFGTADGTAIIFAQFIEVPKNEEFPLGVKINIFEEYYKVDKGYQHYRKYIDERPFKVKEFACDPSGKNTESNLLSWIDNLSKNPVTGERDWHFIYNDYYAGKVVEMVDRTNYFIHAIRYNRNQCPYFHKMMRRWQWRTDKNGKNVLPLKAMHNEYSHIGTALYFMIINKFPHKTKELYLP